MGSEDFSGLGWGLHYDTKIWDGMEQADGVLVLCLCCQVHNLEFRRAESSPSNRESELFLRTIDHLNNSLTYTT